MSSTLYDILGVSSSAHVDDIKAAYKKLAKLYHPDKNPGSEWHEEEFKKINHAYQILSDTIKRSQYDYRLEYERFYKERPATPKNPTYQRTTTTYQNSSYQPYSTTRKRTWEERLPNIKNNFYVVTYYVALLSLLGMYFNYRDKEKVNKLFAEAKEFEQKGMYSTTISTYTSILTIEPRNTKAYEKRADAFIRSHMNLTMALKDLNIAVKYTDPISSELLFKRAKCLILMHNYDSAMVDLNQAIALTEPKKDDSLYFYRAEILFMSGEYKKAIDDYSSFLKYNPVSGESHMRRGYSYYTQRLYNTALVDYNYTVRWKPEEGENYYYRAFVQFALNDSTKGCRDLHDSFLLGYNNAKKASEKYCKKREITF